MDSKRVEYDGPYNVAPSSTPPGLFSDLTSRVWRVESLTASRGVVGGQVFMVTLLDAQTPVSYPSRRYQFLVSAEEFEELELDDIIHISLTLEPGILG